MGKKGSDLHGIRHEKRSNDRDQLGKRSQTGYQKETKRGILKAAAAGYKPEGGVVGRAKNRIVGR